MNCCTTRQRQELKRPPSFTHYRAIVGAKKKLRLGLFRGLLLLLCLLGPGRNDAVHARVGDGLTEVLAHVPGDQDESAALRG